MDTADLHPLLDDLDENIDDLEEALEPLLKVPITDFASKLPLLDKAKLHVLTTYAIESILFSYLQLNGIKAKEHPVFTELTRLKQYFEKIKQAETGPLKRALVLDKQAAGRFIKHALSGNERHDQGRAERQAREKANAQAKLDEIAEQQLAKKRKADELVAGDEEADSSSDSATSSSDSKSASSPQQNNEEVTTTLKRKKKKQRTAALESMDEVEILGKEKAEKRGKKDNEKKKSKKRSKLEREEIDLTQDQETETIIPRRSKSNIPPRGHSAAFQALLKGPLPKQENEGKRKKSKKSKADT
ncbi:hypothetical protein K432DRAFT_352391 [Lepidopterella palustris CBS 459.81]|uniref:Exosome complex protein n=1 Tax=Lepidopterella palustris CBS 459.81 TaxID=1314670 RepID=A0A8E2EB72_9PEZI|nr:hypothetical protein K432DRAFT_352391 [Lepidopterella palustris CBS 459.81]